MNYCDILTLNKSNSWGGGGGGGARGRPPPPPHWMKPCELSVNSCQKLFIKTTKHTSKTFTLHDLHENINKTQIAGEIVSDLKEQHGSTCVTVLYLGRLTEGELANASVLPPIPGKLIVPEQNMAVLVAAHKEVRNCRS